MYCYKCGAYIPDGDNFCQRCGAEADKPWTNEKSGMEMSAHEKKPEVMFSSLEDEEGKAPQFEDKKESNLPHVVMEQTGAAKAGTMAAKSVGMSLSKKLIIAAAVAAAGTTTTAAIAVAVHKPAPQVAEVVSEPVSVPEIISEAMQEETSEVTVEPTPESTPEPTPEVTPEAEKVNIEDVVNTYACAARDGVYAQAGYYYCVADLNGDGIPELLAYGGVNSNSWLQAFTYSDGQIKSLCGTSEKEYEPALEKAEEYRDVILEGYPESESNHYIEAKKIYNPRGRENPRF